MQIQSCAQSDLGRSRSVNEDFYLVDDAERLYVVADGMGGHGNGEIASRVAVEAMVQSLRGNPSSFRPWSSRQERIERSTDRLRSAIKTANGAVLREVQEDSSLAGMGATVVALLVTGETGVVAHVGDSRLYRLRDGELEQLTADHTWVHEQVSLGLLSMEDAKDHPFRSVVTRAVGGGEDVIVDVHTFGLRPGDRLLLCSDGLNAVLSDSEIAARISADRPLDGVCSDLIDATNDGGGPDNITVLLLDVS